MILMRSSESLRSLARPADDPTALRRYLAATLRQVSKEQRSRPACAGRRSVPAPPACGGIPFAFAAWIDHLFFLDALLDPALGGMHATELFPEERRGLELLRQAREEFWRRHELCPGCGALLIRGGTCLPCSLLASAGGGARLRSGGTSEKP